MKKPATLRRHLEAHVPHLRRYPDKIHIYIGEGRLVSKLGKSLSFEWHYELKVLFTDFIDSPDTIVVPLLSWIATNQYDIFLDPDARNSAIKFESEVIDHEKIDILFRLPLTERVVVTPTDNGWQCEHCDEPPLPIDNGVTPWQIFLHGELILESSESIGNG